MRRRGRYLLRDLPVDIIDAAVDHPAISIGIPAAVLVIVAIGYGPWAQQHLEDPYFRSTSCTHQSQTDPVQITEQGITAGCVVTYNERYGITNRLTDHPVTLCLGRHGHCDTGHTTPFRGGTLTIQPQQTATAKFPIGPAGDRNYPITVRPVPDLSFTNLDLVVSSAPEPPLPGTALIAARAWDAENAPWHGPAMPGQGRVA